MIGKNAIKAGRYGSDQKGIFFRRELPQLEAAIERCKQIYLPLGWQWAEQKKTFTAPNGATLKFRSLERDADAEKYQGHDYTDVYCEELTNWPDPKPIKKLKATLRSAAGVPCQFHATTNPGGPGHNWVKAAFHDPYPAGYKIQRSQEWGRFVYIPAKVEDNRILLNSDPTYIDRLKQSGSEALVKAWLEGRWDIVDGAFFDCWTPDMILAPFSIPPDWTRFRAFDWGSAAPFSVGWYAICPENYPVQGRVIERGALIKYREWYGAKAPNEGLKLTAEQVRDGILEREKGEKIAYGVADPAIFAEDGGPSIAERMMPVAWRPADNKRVARAGQIGGWDQMRRMMVDEMLYFFSTCKDSIRTIPALQHDSNRPEDVDTNSEDHAADETRYAVMSRAHVVKKAHIPTEPRDAWGRRQQSNSWRTV